MKNCERTVLYEGPAVGIYEPDNFRRAVTRIGDVEEIYSDSSEEFGDVARIHFFHKYCVTSKFYFWKYGDGSTKTKVTLFGVESKRSELGRIILEEAEKYQTVEAMTQ